MLFGIIVLIIWILYVVIYKKYNRKAFRYNRCILPLVLFSILITVDLGINFVAGSIPSINDGIGIYGVLSYWIIGENYWSSLLFLKYYKISFVLSIILLMIYAIIKAVEKEKKK